MKLDIFHLIHYFSDGINMIGAVQTSAAIAGSIYLTKYVIVANKVPPTIKLVIT